MGTSLQVLRSTTRRLINETDSSNSHFEDQEINDYLNQAVTFLGTQMEWDTQVDQATSVQDQNLYQLPDDFIALTDVYFDSRRITIVERADLGTINSQWQLTPSGTPQYAYKSDTAVIGLYPAPDAAHAGLLIQIQYVQLPAELITDTDIPDLHTAFQMCLPFYAAFLCDYKLDNQKTSDRHLQMYDAHRKALMSKVQKYSDDLLRFRWGNFER